MIMQSLSTAYDIADDLWSYLQAHARITDKAYYACKRATIILRDHNKQKRSTIRCDKILRGVHFYAPLLSSLS